MKSRDDVLELVRILTHQTKKIPTDRSLLAGVSGIDASGKGFVTRMLASELESAGWRVAAINVDGWLNLPHVRFSNQDPGEHFYHHALRLDEMFSRLVLPLKRDRGVDLLMDFADETATTFRPHNYHLTDIDIIIVEGIFIFKRAYVDNFDLKIWIECSFESALGRAIERGQEGLPVSETIAAYESIYFPAQRYHFEVDKPRDAADIIFRNE